MLTKSQYEELLKYCGDGAKYDGNLTEPLRFLIRKKYVVIYHPVLSGGEISNTSVCVITKIGKDALAEYERSEDEMRQQKADNDADKAIDRKFQTKQTILNAIICAIASALLGIAISHFSEIVGFLASLFHG